jgi:hypothetical protein
MFHIRRKISTPEKSIRDWAVCHQHGRNHARKVMCAVETGSTESAIFRCPCALSSREIPWGEHPMAERLDTAYSDGMKQKSFCPDKNQRRREFAASSNGD